LVLGSELSVKLLGGFQLLECCAPLVQRSVALRGCFVAFPDR
jgi:hypothetical protein